MSDKRDEVPLPVSEFFTRDQLIAYARARAATLRAARVCLDHDGATLADALRPHQPGDGAGITMARAILADAGIKG